MKISRIYIFLTFTLISFGYLSAAEPAGHWVFFTGKAMVQPADVPARVLERRNSRGAGAALRQVDLPVNPDYVRAVQATGANLRHVSRWFNAVSVNANTEQLSRIRRLPFVAKTEPVRVFTRRPEPEPTLVLNKTGDEDYGPSLNQNAMIGVPEIHAMQLDGSGVRIAVFDTGFLLEHEAVDHVNVIDQWDFVQNDAVVSNQAGDFSGQHNHGTQVLGILAGHSPGNLIGPAWNAEFLLAKTEDIASERHIEEDNWVAAAEWAEENGADIITTSLGYSTFDAGEGNYTYADMDGNTAIITRAADLAVKHGIVVLASAGNEGNSSWHYISAPADGDSVLAIGGVTSDGSYWTTSSHGPTADGRIKPDVSAQGSGVYTVNPYSTTEFAYGSGTSFSCPLAAGSAALILQMNPQLTPVEVGDILRNTASRADKPNNDMGYGILSLSRIFDEYFANPVQIASYRVQPLPGRNVLDWSVGREINVAYWSLQRQVDNSPQYTEIDRAEGRGVQFTGHDYRLVDSDIRGGETIRYRLIAGMEDGQELLAFYDEVLTVEAGAFTLLPNYPNPFNGTTRLTFSLPAQGQVELHVYDAAGRLVREIFFGQFLGQGFHTAQWDGQNNSGKDVASGVYLVRLRTQSETASRKIILIR
jgi:serine protease AprX